MVMNALILGIFCQILNSERLEPPDTTNQMPQIEPPFPFICLVELLLDVSSAAVVTCVLSSVGAVAVVW